MKKVTVIGGGTGTFVVLSGLKKYPIDLSVIVSMMDSGGSTGRLRDQLGVLPPGDLRQCLVALSGAPLLWRKLFLYRFKQGDLEGHNFGNLFLSALEKVSKNYDEVVQTASYVLDVRGHVIPSTYRKTHLRVEYANGSIVTGEGNIDENFSEKSRVKKASLSPLVPANPAALKAIEESDFIIMGPGDLYASIVAVLLAKGIKEAIVKSKAKLIYIANLMTKGGQTTGYTAHDHLEDIQRYLGREINITLLNDGKIDSKIIKKYEEEHEQLVKNDLFLKGFGGTIVVDDIVDKRNFDKSQGEKFIDPKVRSILRHDPAKLAKILSTIILK